jgi:hypothetical protein
LVKFSIQVILQAEIPKVKSFFQKFSRLTKSPVVPIVQLMQKFKIIGISGVGRAGKDSFYNFAKQILEEKGISSGRWAFADELKKDLDPFIQEKFGFSAFTEITEEKDYIRPLMVEYGKIWRKKSKGSHWLDKIRPQILSEEGPQVRFITDLRFAAFGETDEAHFVQSNGGKIIHIEKLVPINGSGNFEALAPANDEEKVNDPKVKKIADLKFRWNHFSDGKEELGKKAVSDFLERNCRLWKI